MNHSVVVHVVTYNSAETICATLRALLAQTGFVLGQNLKVHVTDNCSVDGSANLVAQEFGASVELHRNATNTGFTGAHNRGPALVRAEDAGYLLILNPDLRLEPEALQTMVRALALDPRAGAATPRLYRADAELNPVQPLAFDACGMVVTESTRHFDRGSEELDVGQYETDCYVFGGSGACLLIRRNCLEDVLLQDPATGAFDLFDDAFFAYREDADLAWRMQWLGWKTRYVAAAIGYHKRVVLPERRKQLPAELNAFSVRNRFLLQANNFSLGANFRCLPQTLWRNLLVIGGVLATERSSLPALLQAAQLLPRALRRRQSLFRRARARSVDVGAWFLPEPSTARAKPRTEPALMPVASGPVTSVQVVVINYNSGARLSGCLRALSQAITELRDLVQIEVVVVDNASSDASASRLQPLFAPLPQFRFELLSENLGFAGGIMHACNGPTRNGPTGNGSTADAILVLNPDLEIGGSALLHLVHALEAHAELGAVAPVFRSREGALQLGFCAKSFPTLGSTLAELFFLHRLWPKNPWTAQYHRDEEPFTRQYLEGTRAGTAVPQELREAPLVVDQPPAACLCIRRTALEQVGGFDTRFWPAWFEDVDFAKRLRASGFLSAVVAQSSAVHEGGYSKELLGTVRFAEIWYPNMLRYWHKHGTAFEQTMLGALLPLALLLRAVVALGHQSAGLTLAARRESSLAFLRLARKAFVRDLPR